jgi:hypothetical protein
LQAYPDWKWVVTTSRSTLAGNDPGAIEAIEKFAKVQKRFIVKAGLTKDEYYAELAKSTIQFNCSSQDYVSWTCLEACIAGCDLCYPNYRSFPEFMPSTNLYLPFETDSAIQVLQYCISNPSQHKEIAKLSDRGRIMEARTVLVGTEPGYEIDIWNSQEK